MTLSTEAAIHKDKRTSSKPVRMEHRHFALIAKIISELPLSAGDKAQVAYEFKYHLNSTNPNFNGERFYNACGV